MKQAGARKRSAGRQGGERAEKMAKYGLPTSRHSMLRVQNHDNPHTLPSREQLMEEFRRLVLGPILRDMPDFLRLRYNASRLHLEPADPEDFPFPSYMEMSWDSQRFTAVANVGSEFERDRLESAILHDELTEAKATLNEQSGRLQLEVDAVNTTNDLQCLAPAVQMMASMAFRDAWLLHCIIINKERGWAVDVVQNLGFQNIDYPLFDDFGILRLLVLRFRSRHDPALIMDVLVEPPHNNARGRVGLFPKLLESYPMAEWRRRSVALPENGESLVAFVNDYDTIEDATRVMWTLRVALL